MQIIKNRQIIENDPWLTLADGATVPESVDVIVTLARWNSEHAVLTKRSGRTGIRLAPSDDPAEIQNLHGLGLIAVEFPKFGDGRGYSHARLLRERYAYRGELRAVGNVLRDQLFYMTRCGIDSFALQPGKDVQGALEAFAEFSITYQGAADDARPIYRRQRAAAK
jgi:uncharacterized protein (DUF934 family)